MPALSLRRWAAPAAAVTSGALYLGVATGRLSIDLDRVPQTLSHLALINAACAFERMQIDTGP